ncbi:hypothetical protein GCM10010505_54700 [Kitasatospora aburaviensis]
MANLVYKRVSTDQQSTARQNVVLDEAGIEDPVEAGGFDGSRHGSGRHCPVVSAPGFRAPAGTPKLDRISFDPAPGTPSKGLIGTMSGIVRPGCRIRQRAKGAPGPWTRTPAQA